MAELKMLMAYFCKYYPYKDDISKARLNKMIYLADWKSAIDREMQVSNIKWIYNNYGPYVNEIAELAKQDDWFAIYNTLNDFGHKKNVIYINDFVKDNDITLLDCDKQYLNYVIDTTHSLNWADFIRLVYSTYPIISSNRKSNLNLVEKAMIYNEIKYNNTYSDSDLPIHIKEIYKTLENITQYTKWNYQNKTIIYKDLVFNSFKHYQNFITKYVTNIGDTSAPIKDGEYIFKDNYSEIVNNYLEKYCSNNINQYQN